MKQQCRCIELSEGRRIVIRRCKAKSFQTPDWGLSFINPLQAGDDPKQVVVGNKKSPVLVSVIEDEGVKYVVTTLRLSHEAMEALSSLSAETILDESGGCSQVV